MVSIENLTIRAGAFVIRDVNLTIPTGQYAVLMGKTGSGKTTILEAVCGLRAVLDGRILLDERDVTRSAVWDRQIGYVPQDRALFSTMSVHEHLALALVIRHVEPRAIRQRVEQLADLLGIMPLLDRGVANLSGGEAQRVALGRALSHQPRILLLDEPLSALDESTRGQLCELLKSIQRQLGMTILHVTHSRSEAQQLADRLFVLENSAVRSAT